MAAAPATTAAAEPVKSGGGGGSSGGGPSLAAADTYIGSLISLTSKSDIRYQGFLFHINPQESIVGLRNVKSFGTEGRKKDGPQILPNDKVYEYIYFRGSDIKDLQVLSSPPVQSKLDVPCDPAIIQSHFLHATAASTSLVATGAAQFTNSSPPTSLMASGAAQVANFNTSSPTSLMASGAAQVTNFNANIPMGFPALSFPGNLPPYQYRGGSGSFPPPPNQNVNGLATPIYQPGLTGSTGAAFYLQPQTMPPVPQVLAISPSVQPQMRHPNINASLARSTSNLSELTHPLLPPLTIDFSKTTSIIAPSANLPSDFGKAASLASSSSLNLMPNTNAPVAFPNMAMSASLPVTPSSTTSLIATAVKTPSADIPKSILGSLLPHQNIPLSMQSLVGTSNESFSEAQAAPLLKPGQVLQPGFKVPPNSLQTAHKDIETVHTSAPNSLSLDSEVDPRPSEQLQSEMAKQNGASSRTHQSNRGRSRGRGIWHNGAGLHSHRSYRSHIPGRGEGLHRADLSPHHFQRSHYRGSLDGLNGATPHTDRYNSGYEWERGTKLSPTLTKFSEDFDFEAMNEKFNKEELWGLLGKGRKLEVEDVGEDENESDENDVDALQKHDTKPVYVKDDFFDLLSPNLPDFDSGKGKMRHSEQMKLDAETFGEFRSPRRGRGTRGLHWGGVSRGYNAGRGLGRGGSGRGREDGRGRGHGRAVWSRVT